MQVDNRANPGIGRKLVVVEVELAVLVANGRDEAGSGRDEARPSRARLESGYRPERVRAAVGCTPGADALDDVCQGRVDVVSALALDAVELLYDCARTRVDGQYRV